MSGKNPNIERLLAANSTFAQSYTAPITMKQLRMAGPYPVLVLTCMDPRVVPEQFLGPEAKVAVFRNAGGRATKDVVRTITVVRSLILNAERVAVMVVHHTDCGMAHITDDLIKEDAKKRGVESGELVHVDFGCFAEEDLEKTILEDVETLKKEKVLEGVEIKGYVLSTETGVLSELI